MQKCNVLGLVLAIAAVPCASCGSVTAAKDAGPTDASSGTSDASEVQRLSEAGVADQSLPSDGKVDAQPASHADVSTGEPVSSSEDAATQETGRAEEHTEAGGKGGDGAGGGGGGGAGDKGGDEAGAPEPEADGSTQADAAFPWPSLDSGIVDPTCERRTLGNDGVFVDAVHGADTTDCGGAIGHACKTIQTGIKRATGLKSIVYIAAGTYEERISLASGLTLEGGWAADGAGWKPVCTDASAAVVIRAPTNSNKTILADALTRPAVLSHLTVTSKAAASAGESLYGIFVTGSATVLTLSDVRVLVANGGDGADGTAGVGGSNGAPTGCAPAGDGGNGVAAGGSGADGQEGTFSQTGYTPGNGAAGKDGQPGHNGTAGASGMTATCGSCANSHSTECRAETSSRGGDGLPGCGGAAGKGGAGGLGGGSSVALYVWQATVNVEGSILQSGNGGTGGKGGRGGSPGVGTVGAAGAAGPACSKCSTSCASVDAYGKCASYSCTTTSGNPGAPGAGGGLGGNGTPGGDGGAGPGGSSFAIYKGGTPTVDVSTTTQLTPGRSGTSRGGAAPGTAKPIGP